VRLVQLLKDKSIKEVELKECFESLGWEFTSINKKITLDEANQILDQLKVQRKNQIFKNHESNGLTHGNSKKIKSKVIDVLPIVFRNQNPFEAEIIQIIKGGSDFDQRVKRNIQFENQTLETMLTDFEASAICSGLSDVQSKTLGNRYISGDSDAELIFNLHLRAKETIEKYGELLIFQLIKLPPLPVKTEKAHQIFLELDKKKKITEDPFIRLLFENEKIQFSFFKKNEGQSKSIYSNVIIARNSVRNEDLFMMSRDGRVIPLAKTTNVAPVICTFISYSSDLQQHIIHYGMETGECSICGRTLSDLESIRIGIGPVCRELISPHVLAQYKASK
jgi:hypothetical protein